jgi:hypothetical protein
MDSFQAAAHHWRQSYQIGCGKPASDVLNSQDPFIQHQLTKAVEKFLENVRNGERFWSANRTCIQDSELQFPGAMASTNGPQNNSTPAIKAVNAKVLQHWDSQTRYVTK